MIDPTRDDLQRFFAEPDAGPVVMLNLLRFVDGGQASYQAYARAIEPLLASVGATIVYAGLAGAPLIAEPEQAWDAVVLVRYPDRAAFARMVGDPRYREIVHFRTAALRETVLQPTAPWSP